MNRNIYENFLKVSPNRVAIEYKNTSISFGELKNQVEKLLVLLLNLGCNERTLVGFLLEETPEIIVALLAISKLNAKFFVINPKYPVSMVESLIFKLKPKIVIAENSLATNFKAFTNWVKSSINFFRSIYLFELSIGEMYRDENIFSILFTSGTTQLPKGVYHRQEDFIFVGERCFSAWNIKDDEKFLSMIPLFSAATFGCIVVPALCYGHCIVLSENRKPDTLIETIQNKKVSFVIGVPTSFIKLEEVINMTNNMKFSRIYGTVAGAPIPDGFVKRIHSTLGIKLYPHYGMTELLAVTSVSEKGDFETVGQPLRDIELKIGKDNEILVKTPAMTIGYIDNSPLPIDEEGFFKTSDLGRIDVAGNLKIIGRKDDMIIRGGNNIYPSEIENILTQNSNVSSCAVIGVPDTKYGQKIVAFVKLREKGTKEEELKEFLQQSLPLFKIPDEFIFIDNIPMTESGKIKKHELKTLYSKLQK